MLSYDEIDPGIRETVRRLNSLGFDTTDSGDGVSKPGMECALSVPNVSIACAARDLVNVADRLVRELKRIGIAFEPIGRGPVFVQATYDPTDGTASIQLIGVNDGMWWL